MARDIIHGIEIHAEPKVVYDTIATRSGLAVVLGPRTWRAMTRRAASSRSASRRRRFACR